MAEETLFESMTRPDRVASKALRYRVCPFNSDWEQGGGFETEGNTLMTVLMQLDRMRDNAVSKLLQVAPNGEPVGMLVGLTVEVFRDA